MADNYCASCDEIHVKCKFLTKDDISFSLVGQNLVLTDATNGATIGSVSAGQLCVALAAAGCSLGGGGGGSTPMTGQQIADALCGSPSAQITLGACLKDDVAMRIRPLKMRWHSASQTRLQASW